MFRWVNSFFDERAIDLPHKLYQSRFAPEFRSALSPSLRPIVDWVEPFLRDHADQVQGRETQYFCWGARRRKAAQMAAARGRRVGRL